MFSTRMISTIGVLIAGTTVARAQEIDMGTPAPGPTVAGDEVFRKGTLGFSLPVTLLSNVAASVTGTTERVPTIDLIYFLNDKAAVDVIMGINFHRKQVQSGVGMTTDTNLFGFVVGMGYRMYSSKNNLRSFIEPSVVLNWADTSASSSFALTAGAAFGVERNLTPWFSFSGAAGAGLGFANSFKDIQLATSANLAANLYWR
jgi:hypothetical protein